MFLFLDALLLYLDSVISKNFHTVMANGEIWPTYMYSSRILPPSIHHDSEDLCAMYCHVDTSCSFYMHINTTCHLGNCSPNDVLNPDQTSSTAPLYFKKGKSC